MTRTDWENPFPQLTFVGGALMVGMALFVAVAYAMLDELERSAEADTIVPVLAAVGLAPLAVSFFVRRFLLENRRRALKSTQAPEAQWAQAYAQTHVLAMALCEATAVFGFTITFLSANLAWVSVYAALGVAGIGAAFPTPVRYRRWKERR